MTQPERSEPLPPDFDPDDALEVLLGNEIVEDEPAPDLDDEVTLDAQVAQPSAAAGPEELLAAADPFADLDALLDESMEQRAVEQQARAARERLRRGVAQAPGERQADLDRIKLWQDRYEWLPIATAGVFNRFSCACGNTSTIFDCIMIEEKHKTDPWSKRFVNVGVERRASPRVGEPPRVTVVREQAVVACDKCAHTKGWRLDDPTIWRS